MAAQGFYSVILAGGSGTRLWPLSRAANPKFLHALTGSPASLLQATHARLAPLSAPEAIYVVTGTSHAAAVARQLPDLPDTNLLVEPSPRDSCAAIGLAAAVIAGRDPDALMGSFASDHLVRDEASFVDTVRAAVAGAHAGRLMTVGIKPTHVETGYGYLQLGEAIATAGVTAAATVTAPGITAAAGVTAPGITTAAGVRAVSRFKEKPARDVAEAYLASGQHLWNASMFVWRVDAFLAELDRQQPDLGAGVRAIAEAWGTTDQETVLGEIWPTLPKISVDHAVMEGAAAAGLVATVPGDFGWTDVGDFDTLGAALAAAEPGAADGAGNITIGEPKQAPVLLRDTTGSVLVPRSGRLVAMLGVRDLIVVDTPDALLVCARDQAQRVKSVVDELRQQGEDHYL